MVLYILIPYEHDETYNNYMNVHFKFNKFEFPYNTIYINGQDISPNDNDYLLVCDIQSLLIKQYYDKYIGLFPKQQKACFIYEHLLYDCHQWKIQYIFDNFGLIFQNIPELIKIKNVYWIPTCNLHIVHHQYNTIKTKFCAVSPIFDLGLYEPLDQKRIERIYLIKQFCDKSPDILVYGHELWKQIINEKNFIGKLEGEENCGIVGKFDLKQKIINKCNVLSQYKFILVFENMFIDGYVSEKFVESMYSDSVVIYYGSKNIKKIYPEVFDIGVINGHDYSIDDIIMLMQAMSDEEYNKRINTMKKYRDKINYTNSSENVKKFVAGRFINYINENNNEISIINNHLI